VLLFWREVRYCVTSFSGILALHVLNYSEFCVSRPSDTLRSVDGFDTFTFANWLPIAMVCFRNFLSFSLVDMYSDSLLKEQGTVRPVRFLLLIVSFYFNLMGVGSISCQTLGSYHEVAGVIASPVLMRFVMRLVSCFAMCLPKRRRGHSTLGWRWYLNIRLFGCYIIQWRNIFLEYEKYSDVICNLCVYFTCSS
jgi:hypothetical protein